MKPIDPDQQPFKMVFDDKLTHFLSATRSGDLEPRDGTVLLAIMRHTNWRTSKANITITALARELGQKDASNVSRSVSRLKTLKMVAAGVDRRSGERFLMLNPYLCCKSSKPDVQRALYGQFRELLD